MVSLIQGCKFSLSVSVLIGVLLVGLRDTKGGQLEIDSGYFRKASEFDPGTVYTYVKNAGDSSIRITSVGCQDLVRGNYERTAFFWKRIMPNPVPAGQIAEIAIKFRQVPPKAIRVVIGTAKGQRLEKGIAPVDNPFVFSFIAFDERLASIYLYVRNTSQSDVFTLGKLFVNNRELPYLEYSSLAKIYPEEVKCLIVNLDDPLSEGQFVAVKLETVEGQVAESMVRAFENKFPIRFENDSTDVELFMDPDAGRQLGKTFIGPHAEPGWKICHASSRYKMFFCPAHLRDSIVAAASEILRVNYECAESYVNTQTCLHICRSSIEPACFIFGELADVIRINPSLALLYSLPNSSLDVWQEPVQYLTSLARRACTPKTLHTVTPVGPNLSENVNPSGKLARFLVYCQISRGSKGILYRATGELQSQSESASEIASLNLELQVLKRFLKLSERFDLGECSETKVEVCTLLAGSKGIIVILINHDIQHLRTGRVDTIRVIPKRNLVVIVRIPDGMEIRDAYEAGDGYERIIYDDLQKYIVIRVDSLQITKQIVLTSDLNDYDYDSDSDGIPDIKEVTLWRTHPAICNTH